MNETTRRTFAKETLGSLLTMSLLETIFAEDLLAAEIKPITARWMAEVEAMSQELKGKKLPQRVWQKQMERLLNQVDLPDLLKFLDFDKLTRNIQFQERGERSVRAKFPEVEGLPKDLVFGHQIFALRKGRSVVPHGHNNMATSFIVLRGEFHGRHYDRLEDDRKTMIIKPTIDRQFGPGEYSTISDHKNNVHWFKATSETAFIFNIHVLDLNALSGVRNGRIYVDPNGEQLSGGRIRARKLKTAEAFKLYG